MTSWEVSASGVSAYKVIIEATVSGSTVTVKAKWRRDSYGYSSYSAYATVKVTIDGTTWSDTWNFSAPGGGSISTKTLMTKSKNVGYKGTVNVRVVVDFDVSPGSGSISKNVDVSTTPGKPGKPSLSLTLPDVIKADWSNAASNGDSVDLYWGQTATDSAFTENLREDKDLPGSAWTIHSAPLGKRVYVRSKAHNDNGWGAYPDTAYIDVPPKPSAPSALAVTRVSDSQQSLTWTRNSTYTSVIVQRSTNGGAWQSVGTAAGNAAAFSDATTSGNLKYQYRVAGVNGSGQSGWSDTATIYTTPAAPTGVKATRKGDDIVISAGWVSAYATSFDVMDGSTVVATGVSLPWTDVDPDKLVTHTYKVRAKVGSITGGWSAASNTVQLLAPPNAPGGLKPNGGLSPSDGVVRFSWVHNPVDSSDQTAFELRYRVPAGSWTTVTGTTAEFVDVDLDVGSWEWQVRTKGAYVDFSPWSSTATVEVIDRPGVAITQPTGDEWNSSTLPVAWTWFQAQDRPQSAWQAQLVDSASNVVETRSGSGAGNSFTVNQRLTEGDWTVNVRAATGGIWSDWATVTFPVAFIPPAPPAFTGLWDESQGGVLLTAAEGSGGQAVYVDAWYAEFA